jgi:hypothetical protein
MNIGPGSGQDGAAKMKAGEIVVMEGEMTALFSEDVLDAILAMVDLERKSPRKK